MGKEENDTRVITSIFIYKHSGHSKRGFKALNDANAGNISQQHSRARLSVDRFRGHRGLS